MGLEAILAVFGWVAAPVIGKFVDNVMDDNEKSKPPSLGTGPKTHNVSRKSTLRSQHSISQSTRINSQKSSSSSSGSIRTTQNQHSNSFQTHINNLISKLRGSYSSGSTRTT
ncbi:hypothetical protein IHE45_17G114600 [Dioscorea alata]|uniref:Uncharacterized protein n=1 Tax=Dioscorea alata TaxID=55571 RepID=A0ACB7UEP9_DIOAL|nr:hypothetical protein IHE45_17G114600 [Dioscorea alata]